MLFPAFEGKRAGYVHLAEYASRWLAGYRRVRSKAERRLGYRVNEFFGRVFSGKDPAREANLLLLHPTLFVRMLEDLHQELGVDYSYGGYLERRGELWRDTYLDHMKDPLHLGVDFNVPAGTSVVCNRGGRVLRVDDDSGEKHGWGTRIMVHLTNPGIVLVYAHLDIVFYRVGERIKPNEPFGFVGSSEHNGGWYPHLHVQAMIPSEYREFARARDALGHDPDWFDGYGPSRERADLAWRFPDPLPFLTL